MNEMKNENEKAASDKTEKNVGKFSFVFTIFLALFLSHKTAIQPSSDLLIVWLTFFIFSIFHIISLSSFINLIPIVFDPSSMSWLIFYVNNEKVLSPTRKFITSMEDLCEIKEKGFSVDIDAFAHENFKIIS